MLDERMLLDRLENTAMAIVERVIGCGHDDIDVVTDCARSILLTCRYHDVVKEKRFVYYLVLFNGLLRVQMDTSHDVDDESAKRVRVELSCLYI